MPRNPQRHTPGPWQVCKAAHPFKFTIESTGMNDNDNLSIAKLKGPDAEHNARLIAAAPDLLEACKYVISYHREHDSGSGELFGLDFVTTCISAVRQAEGK